MAAKGAGRSAFSIDKLADEWMAGTKKRQEDELRARLRVLSDWELASEAEFVVRERADAERAQADPDDPTTLGMFAGHWQRQLDILQEEMSRRISLWERGGRWPQAPARWDMAFAHRLRERMNGHELVLFLAHRFSVPLKRSGRTYVACCPFHVDRTPSFVVFPDGGWKCFGCQKGGDVYSFLKETGLGFRQAVEVVAAELGVPLPKPPADVAAEAASGETAPARGQTAMDRRGLQRARRAPAGS